MKVKVEAQPGGVSHCYRHRLYTIDARLYNRHRWNTTECRTITATVGTRQQNVGILTASLGRNRVSNAGTQQSVELLPANNAGTQQSVKLLPANNAGTQQSAEPEVDKS